MSETPEGNGAFIRITNREIWDGLQDVKTAVQQMDNRVNNVLGENVELRKRVRALELKTYTLLAGAGSTIVFYAIAAAKGVVG